MKRYAAYKDSGVEWLGEIPVHWDVKKFKFLYNCSMGATILKSDLVENGGIPVYSATESDDLFGYVNETNVLLEVGDFVIPARGNSIGFVTLIDRKATCTQTTIYAKKKVSIHNDKYIFHYLLGLKPLLFQFENTAIPQITVGQVKENFIALPPLAEQTSIAHFLDRKTSQIDSLVEKKKRLIELLKEEKTAVINQAVTKGLDPNVKLKDSGVEWLGEIPAHWEVKKLKWVAGVKYGLGQPPRQLVNGLPLLRATNVERGKINTKDLIFVDPADIPYDRDPILKTGDIIVVRSGAYTADSAMVSPEFDGSIAGYDMVVRLYDGHSANFFAFGFLSHYILFYQLYLLRMRAAQPHLNREELNETIFFIPPLAEQTSIAHFLDRKTSQINSTISKIEKEIELLQEYRTALISEVVTGKVRVE